MQMCQANIRVRVQTSETSGVMHTISQSPAIAQCKNTNIAQYLRIQKWYRIEALIALNAVTQTMRHAINYSTEE